MGLLSSLSSAIFDRPVSRGAPSYYGAQSSFIAGPSYVDAFRAKRAPAAPELVEQYKSLVYACTQINACGVMRVPLRLYADATKGGKPRQVSGPRSISRSVWGHLNRSGYVQRTNATKQDVQEITTHPMIDALDHPDPEGYFSREDVLGLISAYCDVVGVAYLKMDPPGRSSPPSYLWPLQAQYVYDFKRSGSPVLDRYTYFADTYRPDEILRFRVQLSLRDPYGRGYCPTYAALQYAMLEDKYVAVQDQLLGMGPRPNLLVSPKDATMPLGEPERQRYIADLMRQHSRGNAGGVLVTNGAVDVNTLSYSPTDLGGLTISEYDLERTCNCFGVPVSYFSKETNLANLQAAESQHARTAIEPRCKAIAGTLTRLVRRYDERLFFAFDPCVEEDAEKDARVIDMGLKSGRITINEANTDSPWEAKDWGDEPWLPGTLQQPTMIEKTHEQGLEAQKQQLANDTKATDFQYSEDPGGDSGDGTGGGDDAGARGLDQAVPTVHAGPGLDERFDAILAALERSAGL